MQGKAKKARKSKERQVRKGKTRKGKVTRGKQISQPQAFQAGSLLYILYLCIYVYVNFCVSILDQLSLTPLVCVRHNSFECSDTISSSFYIL